MPQVFADSLTSFLAFILSLTVHECAHAASAKWLGDRTAESEGRLTLNPVAHIDPIGTILMPILAIVLGAPILAWAKPVPVDPRRLRKGRLGSAIVAAAGPLSNLMMTLLFAGIYIIYTKNFGGLLKKGDFLFPLIDLSGAMVITNAVLFVFNFIPLPPLDGGSVFSNLLLPKSWGMRYEIFAERFGFMLLMMLSISGGLTWIHPLSSAVARGALRIAAAVSN
jgi:Zn-dependent protease